MRLKLWLVVCLSWFCFTKTLAAPIAIASEMAFGVNFAYQFQYNNIITVDTYFELPIEIIPYVDTSMVFNAGYSFAQGFDASISLKGILFPSLYGGLIAAGAWIDLSGYHIASKYNIFKASLGPMINFNLEPVHITLSASLLGLFNAYFCFDFGLAIRYYIDVFAIEASIDYNTIGWSKVNIGFRYNI